MFPAPAPAPLSSSPQGLPGKDGETGAAGPPGPAVRVTASSIPLHVASTLILSPPLGLQPQYLRFPDCPDHSFHLGKKRIENRKEIKTSLTQMPRHFIFT